MEVQEIQIQETKSFEKHIEYQIKIIGNGIRSWFVWKRYSDFEVLHKRLKLISPKLNYTIPPKTYWLCTTYDNEELINERKIAFQMYLNNIIKDKELDNLIQSIYWSEFFNIPLKPVKQTRVFNSKEWILEYEKVHKIVKAIRGLLIEKEQASHLNETQELSSEIRKQIVILNNKVSVLDHGIESPDITDAELDRRRELLNQILEEQRILIKMQQTKPKSSTTSPVINSSKLDKRSSEREQLMGNKKVISKRVFGKKETQETKGLDDKQLLQLQKQKMKEQDSYLDQFSTLLSRQKDIGLAITDELDYHNRLLEQLDEQLDKTETKLTKAGSKIQDIN